jgi:predicted DCC family thiol-disulfide oxidoreductase YuxK
MSDQFTPVTQVPDTIVYDGNCNLCVSLVRVLERLDGGQRFQYVPMQAEGLLEDFGISQADCEMGMILIDGLRPERRWQGSDAAEEMVRRFPLSAPAVAAYRALPGAKWLGDRIYAQVRDNRYAWFGQRHSTYHAESDTCDSGSCHPFPESSPPSPSTQSPST